jgi:hypothetical protein
MRLLRAFRLAVLGVLWLLPVAARHLQDAAQHAPVEPAGLSAPAPDAPLLREEHFAIEQVAGTTDLATETELCEPSSSQAGTVVLGVARCRRLTLPDGEQLEWDVQFLGAGPRVLHIERSGSSGNSLVWREILPSAGRTVSARCSKDGSKLSLREWAGRLDQKSEIDGPQALALPLQLLEQARTQAKLPPQAVVFDPLARQLETWSISIDDLGSGARRVDLTRADGTLAARWLLRGSELVGFQWQGGNLRGRRVSAEDSARLLEPPDDPPEH